MGALKAGSRMRWMEMYTAEEAHVDPAALLVIRTEQDVRAMLPLVSCLFLYVSLSMSMSISLVLAPSRLTLKT